MNYKNIVKSTLAVCGTILLGAIGGGVWEHLLGPSLRFTRDFFLNVTSLWITKYKDATYIEVARGFHESAGESLNRQLTLYWILFVIGMSVYLVVLSRKLRAKHADVLKDIENLRDGKTREPITIEKLYKEVHSLTPLLKKDRWLLYAAVFWAIFTVIVSFMSAIQSTYVNSAITHYNQMLSICAPSLSADQKEQIASSFAQIKNKADYEEVINRLRSVAQKHSQVMPAFEIW